MVKVSHGWVQGHGKQGTTLAISEGHGHRVYLALPVFAYLPFTYNNNQ